MTKVSADIPEKELVELLVANRKDGIGLLYDNYAASLYGVVMKIVQSEEVAKDILQDTFVKVWQNFSSYDPTKGRLFTWLLNIARNRAIDYTRSKASKMKQRQGGENEYKGTQQTAIEMQVDQIGLSTVLQMLPVETRETLEVVYFKGYTHMEASDYLNVPLGTVKSRVRNGLRNLRKMMK